MEENLVKKMLAKVYEIIKKINNLTMQMHDVLTGTKELDEEAGNGLHSKFERLETAIFKKLGLILSTKDIQIKKIQKIHKYDKIIRGLMGKVPEFNFEKYVKSRKSGYAKWMSLGTSFQKKIGYAYYKIPYQLVDYLRLRRKMRKQIKKGEYIMGLGLDIQNEKLKKLVKKAEKIKDFLDEHNLMEKGEKYRKKLEKSEAYLEKMEAKKEVYETRKDEIKTAWDKCKRKAKQNIDEISEYIISTTGDTEHKYNLLGYMYGKNKGVEVDEITSRFATAHNKVYEKTKNFKKKIDNIEELECNVGTYMEYIIYSILGVVVPYKNNCYCVPVYIQKIIFRFMKFWESRSKNKAIFNYLTQESDLKHNGYITELKKEINNYHNDTPREEFNGFKEYCKYNTTAFDYIICCALIYRDDVFCYGHLFEKVYEYATNFLRTNNVIMYKWGTRKTHLKLWRTTSYKEIKAGSWLLNKNLNPKELKKMKERNYFNYFRNQTSNRAHGLFLLPIMMKFDVHMGAMYFIERMFEITHNNFNPNSLSITKGGGLVTYMGKQIDKFRVGDKVYKYQKQENKKMDTSTGKRLDERIGDLISSGYSNYDNKQIKNNINQIISKFRTSINDQYKKFKLDIKDMKEDAKKKKGQHLINIIKVLLRVTKQNIKREINSDLVNPEHQSKQSEIIDNIKNFFEKIKKPVYEYLRDKSSQATKITNILKYEDTFFEHILVRDEQNRKKEGEILAQIENNVANNQVNYNNLIGLGISPALTNYLLPRDQYIESGNQGQIYPKMYYYKALKMYGLVKEGSPTRDIIRFDKFSNKFFSLRNNPSAMGGYHRNYYENDSDIVRIGLGAFANDSVIFDESYYYNPEQCTNKKCQNFFYKGIGLHIIRNKNSRDADTISDTIEYDDDTLPTILYISEKANKDDFYETSSIKHPNLNDIEINEIAPPTLINDNSFIGKEINLRGKVTPINLRQETDYRLLGMSLFWSEELKKILTFYDKVKKLLGIKGGNRVAKITKTDKQIISNWLQKGGDNTRNLILEQTELLIKSIKRENVNDIRRHFNSLQKSINISNNRDVQKNFVEVKSSIPIAIERSSYSRSATSRSERRRKSQSSRSVRSRKSSSSRRERSRESQSSQGRRQSLQGQQQSLQQLNLNNTTYSIVDKLGHGGFGDAYLINEVGNKGTFVLKGFKQRKGKNRNNCSKSWKKEQQNLEKINAYCDKNFVCMVSSGKEITINGNEYCNYIILNYVSGWKQCQPTGSCTLKKYNEVNRNINEIISIMRKLLEQVTILHNTVKMAHSDIKPDNILVTKINGNVEPRIIDFGLSCSEKQSSYSGGTTKYMPKWYKDSKGRKFDDVKKYDIYALGMTFTQMNKKLKNTKIINFIENNMMSDKNDIKTIDKCLDAFNKIFPKVTGK